MGRRTLHSIVEIPIGGAIPGRSIPTLFLQDGEMSVYGLAWARNMLVIENLSPSHVSKCMRAVGLIYDFYLIIYGGRPLGQNEMLALMHDFFEARAYGCLALGWKPVGRKTAKKDTRYASEFSKFCSINFGTMQINPSEKKLVCDLNVCEQQTYYENMKTRSTWDLLYHLTPTTDFGQGIVTQHAINPRTGPTQKRSNHHYFPPNKVLKIIAATTSIRDKLAFILLFFGGLRESELLHLYMTDITISNGEGVIRIGHPEHSHYEWNDTYRGEQKGLRLEFLAEKYGSAPRNKLGVKNPLHAGWKGMMYATPDRTLEADFYWLTPEMGRWFAHLHSIYIRNYRTAALDSNPYYFVNFQDDVFGTPLKISNLTKSFYRAAKRIGLSESDPGVNPHGARHFYGHFCASYLRMPIEQTQLMLRHVKLESTQIYYSIDARIVREELRKANEKLNSDIPEFIREQKKLVEQEIKPC